MSSQFATGQLAGDHSLQHFCNFFEFQYSCQFCSANQIVKALAPWVLSSPLWMSLKYFSINFHSWNGCTRRKWSLLALSTDPMSSLFLFLQWHNKPEISSWLYSYKRCKNPISSELMVLGISNPFEKWVIVCNCHQFQPFITRKIFHFILVLLAHQLNFLIIFYLILDEAVHFSSFVKETIIYNSLSSCYIFIHTKNVHQSKHLVNYISH